MNVRVRRHKPLDSFIEQPKFRPEVQGLRSLAVLLVVTYHVWFGKVSGGVDVFLFISAFLLSLSSLRKIQAGKPLKILSYWLHVFQRLLPAAATVIVGTLIASYFIIAPSRWASLLADAKAALFYFLNWRLALNSVDYYAQDATTKTPFQHFWSLSMQGQIFILWPLLFALVAFLVGYLRFKVIPTALLIFGSAFVASLTFSILETSTNQSFAYFDTRTRLWEFAAGTLLAMLVLTWRVPQVLKVPLGWLGVIGLVSCGWLLPVEQAFPGYLALWPLLSGAFVIAAGQTGSRFGVDRILSATPLQKMGAISYCLYLVHWPLLILYTTYQGEPQAGWLDGTLIILTSIALAWLLHNGVEKPLRAWEKKSNRFVIKPSVPQVPWDQRKQGLGKAWVRPIALICVFLSLAGGATLVGQRWIEHKQDQWAANAEKAGTSNFPGALAIGVENISYQNPPIPMERAKGFYDLSWAQSCNTFEPMKDSTLRNPDNLEYCDIYKFGSDKNSPVIVMIGDSHMLQAMSFMEETLNEQDATVIVMTKPWCRFTTEEESFSMQGPEGTPGCQSYNARAIEEIMTIQPDTLVFFSTRPDGTSPNEQFLTGLTDVADLVDSYGGKIIAIRDNPRFFYNMFECATDSSVPACSTPVNQALADENPALSGFAGYENVHHIDLTPYYCPDDICSGVIGNISVYLDDNHMSRQYGKTLTSAVKQQLEESGWSLEKHQETEVGEG